MKCQVVHCGARAKLEAISPRSWHLSFADHVENAMTGPALLLALLLAAGAGRAQVVVDSGKAAGTYDPCLEPPTGVSLVRGCQEGDSAFRLTCSAPCTPSFAHHSMTMTLPCRREIPLCLASPSGLAAGCPTGAPPLLLP